MLSNKKLIITGASSGIGYACVQQAIAEGAKVVAIGRNEENLKKLKEETKCDYLIADLTKPEDCKRVVDEAVVLMGGLTGLVNAAGVLQGGVMGSEAANLNNFMFNMTHNAQSVWSMMESAIPHLKAYTAENKDTPEGKAGATIVNISSVNGGQSFQGVAAYSASKAAVDMLSQCAAIDLAPFNIRVNVIAPGVVETMLQKTGGLSLEAYDGFLTRSKTITHPLAIPREAITQPEDVANLVTFLSSNKSQWITGDVIKIDAGRTCLGAR